MIAPPAPPPQGAALVANAVAFGRLLRRVGVPVEPGQTRAFLEALELVGLGNPLTARAAGRAVYVRRREELPLFDRAFALFWQRHGDPSPEAPVLPRIRQGESRRPAFPAPAPMAPETTIDVEPPPGSSVASTQELLRHADFATLTPAEAEEALVLLDALHAGLPRRPSRRWRRARHGPRPALRTMLRAAVRTDGELVLWRWLRRRGRPRPLVLVADVSGSMERYSRLLLRFAHVLARSGAPLEVFVFGTRLTRITRDLRARDPDDALRRVGRSVVDWNGGTRIGESLRTLNRQWVRRSVRSGAIVLLASDGWERGDPALLEREMATLRRSCYRLLWLDPLAERDGFAPETAGLRAALPHVDGFFPCASVASLMKVARMLDPKQQPAIRPSAPAVRPSGRLAV